MEATGAARFYCISNNISTISLLLEIQRQQIEADNTGFMQYIYCRASLLLLPCNTMEKGIVWELAEYRNVFIALLSLEDATGFLPLRP